MLLMLTARGSEKAGNVTTISPTQSILSQLEMHGPCTPEELIRHSRLAPEQGRALINRLGKAHLIQPTGGE